MGSIDISYKVSDRILEIIKFFDMKIPELSKKMGCKSPQGVYDMTNE